MKLRIFLLALNTFPAISQTTYTSSKYKPVWYSSTYEKTHGTYALFDTSSIKLQWTTSGKPEMKFFGPTGNTLFYLDSTGTISTGTTSGGLLKADFDDSLNNAHTITGLWKFNELVGIGTVTPGAKLEVNGNKSTDTLLIVRNDRVGRDSMFCVTPGGMPRTVGIGNVYNYIISSNSGAGIWMDVTTYDDWVIFDNYGHLDFVNATDSKAYLRINNSGDFIFGTEKVPVGTDSAIYFGQTTGSPFARWNASDGDQSQIAINTSDQLLFQNASGGYVFDADLTYNFIHFVGSADYVSVTPVVTQYIYTKLLPGIVAHETDGVTFAADSLTVLTAGDYICHISISLSGTNANDYWRIKVYKNNAALPNTGANSVGRFSFRTTANNQIDTRNYMWYLKDLEVNDVLSWRITNLSASRNPTVTDMKLYFYKLPE